MRRQKSELRSQKSEKSNQKSRYLLKIVLVCILLSVFFSPAAFGSEKWPGVDESVVEKYAKEHGREAHEPLINTDQGDLLLFVFLLAGAVGGFVAGYSWRILMHEKAPATSRAIK
jgi:ABC-type cobalt transport system substrate-binding protein